jgi:hypothetical protein
MKILQKEKDIAGKFRFWVETSDGKAEMLKFDKNINEEEVFLKMKKILDKREAVINDRISEIDEEIFSLEEEKNLLI